MTKKMINSLTLEEVGKAQALLELKENKFLDRNSLKNFR